MSIFGPEGDGNVIAEEYDSRHEHGLNVRAIGRYIVWYDEAEDKQIYYSVRARKNIDLESDKLFEIKMLLYKRRIRLKIYLYWYFTPI